MPDDAMTRTEQQVTKLLAALERIDSRRELSDACRRSLNSAEAQLEGVLSLRETHLTRREFHAALLLEEDIEQAEALVAQAQEASGRAEALIAVAQENLSQVASRLELGALDETQLRAFADRFRGLLGDDAGTAAATLEGRFTAQAPAHLIAPDDLGAVARELEPLLAAAERFIADESQPAPIRDAVEVRRRTLLGELRLVDVGADSLTIVRATAYLIANVGNVPAVWASLLETDVDLSALRDEVQTLADAAIDLTKDSTAVEAGLEITDSIDNIEEIVGGDTVGAAFKRGGLDWIENDFWKKHVNRVFTAGLTAGGTYAAAQTGYVGAVLRAGRALLIARFPWMFS